MTLLLTLLLGCPRPIPEHLRVPTPDETAGMPDVAVSDLASAVAATIGKDPLGRAPKLLPDSLLQDISGTRPLRTFFAAVRDLESGNGRVDRTMQMLEEEWSGTVAVPLSRGYRLRVADPFLSSEITPGAADRLLPLLSSVLAVQADPAPRSALDWLADDLTSPLVRRYADRWVLTSWLSSPSIPTAHVATLLASAQYDDLRASPVGAILVARHDAGAADPAGFEALTRATRNALHEVAADRDKEQAAWADRRAALIAELGGDDPIGHLLAQAQAGLTPGASSERDAGGALLAVAARRWRRTCDVEPCGGLDRVEMMHAAGRWHRDLYGLAASWRVIALKESLDTLDVGRETVLFPRAIAQLVDALNGTGASAMDLRLLQRQRPDGTVWLSLSRAVGAEGSIEWEGARLALGRHLQREAERALSLVQDQSSRELLDRIARRAIP